MKIANDKNILGKRVNGKLTNTLGWTSVMIMAVAVVTMFFVLYYQHFLF